MADLNGVVTALFTYPIKSCAGVSVPQSLVSKRGLQFDRQWLIVDSDGQFQTQRQIPHLAWIEPQIEQRTLLVSAPNMPTLTLPLAKPQVRPKLVTVWRDQIRALDMGDEAAQWLDDYLQVPGRHFRLVQFDANEKRLSDPFWCGEQPSPLQFADGFALNILSQASLVQFNDRLMQAGGEPVGMNRFRPNLVIDGLDVHEEDLLHTIEFTIDGDPLLLELVKPCPRCQIPSINPLTATHEPEVNEVLSSYRQLSSMDHAVCFAMNAVVRSPKTVCLKVQDRFAGTYRFEG